MTIQNFIAAAAVVAVALLIFSPLLFLFRQKPISYNAAANKQAPTVVEPEFAAQPEASHRGGGIWLTIGGLVIGATIMAFVRVGMAKHDIGMLIAAAAVFIFAAIAWALYSHRRQVCHAAGRAAITTLAAGVKAKRKATAFKASIAQDVERKIQESDKA
ncbi:hypothetical protein RvVAR031_35860 [Agrobacterium vitis]|uniref:hypothetical protein n=1 Tax=Agrobacterium vitis TaxID=373 RepID=UPI0015DA433B|nr:hypothetical protein [Agrobacterium vitis]BCH55976.1 hypothetical protein RvVAR031_35860 [Agrobacterium vitis]